MPNLQKYLFDINPTEAMSPTDRSALPTVGTISGQQVQTLTYRQYIEKTDITVNVQTSPDLQTWTTVINPIIVPDGSDPTTGDPFMQFQVPLVGNRQFIRSTSPCRDHRPLPETPDSISPKKIGPRGKIGLCYRNRRKGT